METKDEDGNQLIFNQSPLNNINSVDENLTPCPFPQESGSSPIILAETHDVTGPSELKLLEPELSEPQVSVTSESESIPSNPAESELDQRHSVGTSAAFRLRQSRRNNRVRHPRSQPFQSLGYQHFLAQAQHQFLQHAAAHQYMINLAMQQQYFAIPPTQQQPSPNSCGALHFQSAQSHQVIVPRVSSHHHFGIMQPSQSGLVTNFARPSTSISSNRLPTSSAASSEEPRISNLPEGMVSTLSAVSAGVEWQASKLEVGDVQILTPLEQLQSQISTSSAEVQPQILTSPAEQLRSHILSSENKQPMISPGNTITEEDVEMVTILAPRSTRFVSACVLPDAVNANGEAFKDLLNELFPGKELMVLNSESIKLIELLLLKSRSFPFPKCTILEIQPSTSVVEFLKHISQLIKMIGSQIKSCSVHLWESFNIPTFHTLFEEMPNLQLLVIYASGSGLGELKMPRNPSMSTIKLSSKGGSTNSGTFLPYLFSCLPHVDHMSFKFKKKSCTSPSPCPPLLNGLHLTEFRAKSGVFSEAVGQHLMCLPCRLESIHLDGNMSLELLHFLWNHKSTLRRLYVSDFKNVHIDYLTNFNKLAHVMFGNRMSLLVKKNGGNFDGSGDTCNFQNEPITHIAIDLNLDSKDEILSLLAVSAEIIDEADFEKAGNQNLYLARMTFPHFTNLTGLMVTIHCTDIFKEIWIHLTNLTELRIEFDAKTESIGVLDPYFIGRELWYHEVTGGRAKVDLALLKQPLKTEYDKDPVNMARLKNLEKFELYLKNGQTTIGDLTIRVCLSKMKKLKHVFAQRTLVSEDQVSFLIGVLVPGAYVRLELYPFTSDEYAISEDKRAVFTSNPELRGP